jgi:hypothetical protein
MSMTRTDQTVFWKRIDVPGLERLTFNERADGVLAQSTVISLEGNGVRLDHRWRLSADWRVLSLDVERRGPGAHGFLRIERTSGGRLVDGVRRGDLDGAEEPDLSVTPFCNSFPIRRLMTGQAESLTLDTSYVDGAALTVARSRQRYERLGPRRFRYVDLGLFPGFEAELEVDQRGLVISYQHLFERVSPEAYS